MLQLVLGGALLLASQMHHWNRMSSGSIFSPEYPRALVILFNWAIGAVLLAAPMQAILDLLSLGSMVLPGRGWAVSDGWRYLLGSVAMLIAAAGVWQAVRVPPLKDLEFQVRNLPASFDGYRLLQLTDLHASRLFQASWVRAVVERSLASNVDVIVVTGDFIDGTVAARRADVEPLRDLRAPDGVWAVTGNHEYIFGAEAWRARIAELGIRILANEHVVLRRANAELVLAGVEDRSASRGGRRHDLDAALAGAPPAAPVLLLDHQPGAARHAAARGVELQLSGHTHGGMVLGLDRVVARANDGFVSGTYDVEGMTLYVNNGTGLWPGFALRLGRPSELTRITLRCAS
jgi:predicted MPP superfamily phosphohydrolase